MDHHLLARWQAGQAPFDGETLYLDNFIPIVQLRTILVSVVAVLQGQYQAARLYTFPDWHENDGFVNSPQSTTWQALEQIVASDQALYDSRAGDIYVRQAFYPRDDRFLLRIYVLNEDEEEEYPGRWGSFDLSGRESVLSAVTFKISGTIRRLLRREPSGQYFNES